MIKLILLQDWIYGSKVYKKDDEVLVDTELANVLIKEKIAKIKEDVRRTKDL